MERIPRAEGEMYRDHTHESDRYDVDIRYKIEPGAALATQLVLMRHMLPPRLKAYMEHHNNTTFEDTIFLKWAELYGPHFGSMCRDLPEEHLVEHIKQQKLDASAQGKTTLTEEELEKMAAYMAEKSPFFTETEIDELIPKTLH